MEPDTSWTEALKPSAWREPCSPNALIWTLASASALFRSPVRMPSRIEISSTAAIFQVDFSRPHTPLERDARAPQRDERQRDGDHGVGEAIFPDGHIFHNRPIVQSAPSIHQGGTARMIERRRQARKTESN